MKTNPPVLIDYISSVVRTWVVEREGILGGWIRKSECQRFPTDPKVRKDTLFILFYESLFVAFFIA